MNGYRKTITNEEAREIGLRKSLRDCAQMGITQVILQHDVHPVSAALGLIDELMMFLRKSDKEAAEEMCRILAGARGDAEKQERLMMKLVKSFDETFVRAAARRMN